jgi:trigger factor
MDVQVTETGPCRRTLTIKIPPETLKGHLDRAFQSASRQVRIKGFRTGQVPRKVLEKRFGEAIRSEAKEQIVSDCFRDVVREHKLQIVGNPNIEGIDASPVDESQTLEFTVHLDVKPEFELGEVRGIEIEALPSAVTDADVENALQQLADQKKTLDSVDDAVEENDFAKADLRFLNEAGEPVHERAGAQLNANIPVAGTDPAAFKGALIGKAKGEVLAVEITFPATFEVEGVRGQRGSVEATILDVQRVQAAAIDDELAKGFEFDDLDALKAELRTRIGEEKSRGERVRQEGAILEILVNDHPFPLPESLIEDQLKHSLAQFRQRLEQARLGAEEIEAKLEESQDAARQDAERRVRLFFLLDAIARREAIQVGREDVDRELRGIAQQHGVGLEEVLKYYQEQNLMNDLQLGILERKVRDFLRENAKITEKEGGSA